MTQPLKIAPRDPLHGERGSILVPTLFVLISMALLSTLLMMSGKSASQASNLGDRAVRTDAVGEAALDLAVSEIWARFLRVTGGQSGSITAFRSHLDTLGIRSVTPNSGRAFATDIADVPELVDVLDMANLPNEGAQSGLAGASVLALEVVREDRDDEVHLRVGATVTTDGRGSGWNTRVERVYTIAGAEFEGFDFALLANNINCLLCHAHIDNADRVFNQDSRRVGTFERVRIGALQSLQIRPGSANTTVAGSIYTRGPIVDDHWRPIANPSSTTLDSVHTTAGGRIDEDAHGVLRTRGIQDTPADERFGSLYTNYPTDAESQMDGFLPESFPSVIPDLNENRRVDPEEFAEAADGADGTVSAEATALVAHGTKYDDKGLPDDDEEGSFTGTVGGHLVLHGTKDDPIKISGRVAIDGDLVIAGYIEGDGELLAKGNIYVTGPVKYNDGTRTNEEGDDYRTFGRSTKGGINRLALGAGGNIIVGTLGINNEGLRSTDEKDTWVGFTHREMITFNRMEWTKTQPTLPSQAGNLSPRINTSYDPNYKPRYYTINEGDPVYLWEGGDAYWDDPTKTWRGPESFDHWNKRGLQEYDPAVLKAAGAEVVSFMPKDKWFDRKDLEEFAKDGKKYRNEDSKAFEIDALVYTNNALVWMSRRREDYKGKGNVNGALVAADMAVLLPGPGRGETGLQVNYDPRLRGRLGLRDQTRVHVAGSMRVR